MKGDDYASHGKSERLASVAFRDRTLVELASVISKNGANRAKITVQKAKTEQLWAEMSKVLP